MDIVLHLGVHRSASTSFQHYLRDQIPMMEAQEVGFWGPRRTRGGLLSGLMPGPKAAGGRNMVDRAQGRIRMQLERAEQRGVSQLLISDENMIGSARHCLRTGQLYPAMGERMARYAQAFGGRLRRVVLSIRSQELWWASAAASTVARGHPVPTPQTFEAISQCGRSWRDVISDLACAMPETEVAVAPFEQFAGRPGALLDVAVGIRGEIENVPLWLNRSPDRRALRKMLQDAGADAEMIPEGDGRWQPFDTAQAARLRELYADDMHWLIAGAEGLATLAQDPTRTETGSSLQAGDMTEGSEAHDSGQEGLARPG